MEQFENIRKEVKKKDLPFKMILKNMGGFRSVNISQEKLVEHDDSSKNVELKTSLQIVRFIGEGGYGEVYKVKNASDQKFYAMKIIPCNHFEKKSKVLQEIFIHSSLDHRHIVKYYIAGEIQSDKNTAFLRNEVGSPQAETSPPELFDSFSETTTSVTDAGLTGNYSFNPAIIMEFCGNGNLTEWLYRNRDLPRNQKHMKRWILQICSAVDHLHRKGIIHRDLKPQNIFISNDEHLKLGDLGLSITTRKALNIAETEKYEGTAMYAAHEQRHNGVITEKIDIYALGLVSLEMLVPFSTVSEKVCEFELVRFEKTPDSLKSKPNIDVFIKQLCAQSPENRLTAEEILSHGFLNISDYDLPPSTERTDRTTNQRENNSLDFGHAVPNND